MEILSQKGHSKIFPFPKLDAKFPIMDGGKDYSQSRTYYMYFLTNVWSKNFSLFVSEIKNQKTIHMKVILLPSFYMSVTVSHNSPKGWHSEKICTINLIIRWR